MYLLRAPYTHTHTHTYIHTNVRTKPIQHETRNKKGKHTHTNASSTSRTHTISLCKRLSLSVCHTTKHSYTTHRHTHHIRLVSLSIFNLRNLSCVELFASLQLLSYCILLSVSVFNFFSSSVYLKIACRYYH